jgi:hypothetical protein
MSVLDKAVETLASAVYVSSAQRELSPSELTELLKETRENNKRRGITGMLLYRGGNFLQVIEGTESAIDALFVSLRRDKRHNGIIVIKRRQIEERQFGEWQMAFRDISSVDLNEMEGYSPFMEFSFTDNKFQANPDQCHKLLLRFKESTR